MDIFKEDMYVTTKRGQRKLSKTTYGWELLVRWKDDTESWIPLKDMKESHPVEVAEFSEEQGISDKPTFKWRVPYTIRKNEVILLAIKIRVRKTTHKFGIEIPTSMAKAEMIDLMNGNHFWCDAIALEMHNVGVTFEVLDDGRKAPPG